MGIHAERLRSQLLSGRPARSAVGVVEHLLAVQAQDPRGMRLAVRTRSTGLTTADVEAGLNERALLVSWLNRGTLHLVQAADYPLLQALTTPAVRTSNLRRLDQEGVPPDDAERGVAAIVRALELDGPLTREALRERVDRTGVRTEGQALVHLLMLASLRGLVVRGPVVGRDQAFVLVADWLGPTAPVTDRSAALGELARRYLAGHGPAAPPDLARWAGVTLGDARRGFTESAGSLQERDDGLAEVRGRRPVHQLPAPRLLGPFDPLLLGWVSRESVIGPHAGLVTSNGIFRPVVLVGGRAVGTWTVPRGQVALDLFEPLEDAVRLALGAEAGDVTRFLTPPG